MSRSNSRSNQRHSAPRSFPTSRPAVERLEGRRLLASIAWSNRGSTVGEDTDGFDAAFAEDAGEARQIVDVAIADWMYVIQNFNYTDPSHPNQFNLIINARDTSEGLGIQQFTRIDADGKPYQGEIVLDNDGLGSGWFIPSKWLGEGAYESFSDYAGEYKRTFFADNTTHLRKPYDLYTTILHEIGHAVGFSLSAGARIHEFLTPVAGSPFTFTFSNGGTTATFEGSHLAGGGDDLMTATQPQYDRRMISPLDAAILRDGYGYDIWEPTSELPKIGVLPQYWGQYCTYYDLTLEEGFGCTVQSLSVPPTLDPITNQVLDEGSLLTFKAEAREPNPGVIFSFSLDAGAPAGATIHPNTGQFSWTPPDGASTHAITIRVSDGGIPCGCSVQPGMSSTKTFTVTVNNVKPAVSASGPSIGVRGQPRTFTLGASDAGADDVAAGFTYVIDWGDGSALQTINPTAGNGSGQNVDHAFGTDGNYTVRVTATDKDGAVSDEVTQQITIGAVGMQADSFGGASGSALVVGGTAGGDSIIFNALRGGAPGVQLLLNNVSQGIYDPTTRLIVFGQGGDDDIQISSGITLAAFLYGGSGNDRVRGGGGPAALVGGDGDDQLVGGRARNLLIGGRGADRLSGSGDEDLEIAGFTAFDVDDPAIVLILSEWTSARDYATRVANLRGTGGGPRANDNTFLRTSGATTVFNDSSTDKLTGAGGRDWFFATLNPDSITDHARDELLDLLA